MCIKLSETGTWYLFHLPFESLIHLPTSFSHQPCVIGTCPLVTTTLPEFLICFLDDTSHEFTTSLQELKIIHILKANGNCIIS